MARLDQDQEAFTEGADGKEACCERSERCCGATPWESVARSNSCEALPRWYMRHEVEATFVCDYGKRVMDVAGARITCALPYFEAALLV